MYRKMYRYRGNGTTVTVVVVSVFRLDCSSTAEWTNQTRINTFW